MRLSLKLSLRKDGAAFSGQEMPHGDEVPSGRDAGAGTGTRPPRLRIRDGDVGVGARLPEGDGPFRDVRGGVFSSGRLRLF